MEPTDNVLHAPLIVILDITGQGATLIQQALAPPVQTLALAITTTAVAGFHLAHPLPALVLLGLTPTGVAGLQVGPAPVVQPVQLAPTEQGVTGPLAGPVTHAHQIITALEAVLASLQSP